MKEPPQILIVDDEPFNVDYLQQELEDLGYQTLCATNGQEALERVADESPDLVLLDVMMPILDGFAVLDRLKADASTRDIPVIIISAMSDMASVVKGIEAGAEDYLPKPCDEALLKTRIGACLEKKAHRDQDVEYLNQVTRLTQAASSVESRTFTPEDLAETAARPDALGHLARVFQHMAQEIYAREQQLERIARERETQLQAQLAQMHQELAESDSTFVQVLEHTSPFDFLTLQEREWLAGRAEPLAFPAGWNILDPPGSDDDRLLLLMAGQVAAGNQEFIQAPAYLNERAVFFNTCAGGKLASASDVRLLALKGEDVRCLVASNAMFRQAFATALRTRHRILRGYETFVNLLFTRADEGKAQLVDLVEAYRGLHPVLHRGSASDELDLDAFAYAIPRLPDNITSAQTLYLAETLPSQYQGLGEFLQVSSRRGNKRKFYEILPNKIIILLRDRVTDTVDLITKLCVYGVETAKLRRRLNEANAGGWLARVVVAPRQTIDAEILTKVLPFSPQELARLEGIFGDSLVRRLYEIVAQAGEISIHFEKGDVQYVKTAFEGWLGEIRRGAMEILNSNELDQDLRVHIISSNTHSVRNCLSPWLREHADWLMQGAPTSGQAPAMDLPADRLYDAARAWFAAHPEDAIQRINSDRTNGIYSLGDASHTGIQITLIDANRLSARLDPALPAPSFKHRTLIVNIDYAYGQQAELIMRQLILLFGHRICSISVFGKSGAVVGRRGDLLLPTRMLLQMDDQLYPISNHDLRPADLLAVGCERPVHTGTMLTVLGTIMQSQEMLYYYRHFYDVVGMEMEGSFYLREIQRALSLGFLRPSLRIRFAYYTSDTPLEANQSLSSSLSAVEGVPAVYAITRSVLRRIFADEESERRETAGSLED